MIFLKKKLEFWLGALVIGGIIGLVIAGVWFRHLQQFQSQAMRTMGNVSAIIAEQDSEGDLTYTPEIQFKDRTGKLYTLRTFISGNEHDHYVGEPMPILYNPQNPAQATVATFWEVYIGLILLTLVSLAALISGGVSLALFKHGEKQKQRLIKQGQKIEATILTIQHVTSLKKNDRSPWILSAQWTSPQNNRQYEFSSMLLWEDPHPYVNNGKVTVYIDPQDPEQYVIDLPELTKVEN